jgi:hypothetical protein
MEKEKIKIWLDDKRINPKGFIWIKSANEALNLINSDLVEIEYISFDHDLGQKLSGYDVAREIEKLCFQKKIKCPDWNVHSANPSGKQNIIKAILLSA